MGCGGSRADAIEPRYYESWTRETESTWLTYTDSDAPPSNAAPDSGPEAGGLHAGECARLREAGARGAPGAAQSPRASGAERGGGVGGGGGGRQTDRQAGRQTDRTCPVTD
uniref:BAALC binder of MAP3K1 and KLF4 n=1 Tax=Moschus moschiferus TaxID=68415 RepID=A0A8C6DUL0_MOSMO